MISRLKRKSTIDEWEEAELCVSASSFSGQQIFTPLQWKRLMRKMYFYGGELQGQFLLTTGPPDGVVEYDYFPYITLGLVGLGCFVSGFLFGRTKCSKS